METQADGGAESGCYLPALASRHGSVMIL